MQKQVHFGCSNYLGVQLSYAAVVPYQNIAIYNSRPVKFVGYAFVDITKISPLQRIPVLRYIRTSECVHQNGTTSCGQTAHPSAGYGNEMEDRTQLHRTSR